MNEAAAASPTRARILDAAERLFYGQGIRAVGVDALAAEAGISKRTLYAHFASKDELIAAYLLRHCGLVEPDGPPLGQILGLFDGLARWFGSRRFRGCPLVNAVAELGADRTHAAVMVTRRQKALRRQWFEQRLHALGAEEPAMLAEQLQILFEGAIATSLVRGGDPKAARSARAAACVLLGAAGVPLQLGSV